MTRKTPVLLRRAPISGGVNALTNYRRSDSNGRDTLRVVGDGKHDVTAAFYATPDIIGILDGAADGDKLNDKQREQVRNFRDRLWKIVTAHNAGAEAGELADA